MAIAKPTNIALAYIAAQIYRGMPNGQKKIDAVSAEALKLYYACVKVNKATPAPEDV